MARQAEEGGIVWRADAPPRGLVDEGDAPPPIELGSPPRGLVDEGDAPPPIELWSLLAAQSASLTLGRDVAVRIRAVTVQHAPALQVLLKDQVETRGWIVTGGGMDHLANLSRLDALLAIGTRALLPLVAAYDSTADSNDVYLWDLRNWSVDVLKAVKDVHGRVPQRKHLSTAGVLIKLKQIAKLSQEIVSDAVNGDQKREWLDKLDEVANDVCSVRYGLAYLPTAQAAGRGAGPAAEESKAEATEDKAADVEGDAETDGSVSGGVDEPPPPAEIWSLQDAKIFSLTLGPGVEVYIRAVIVADACAMESLVKAKVGGWFVTGRGMEQLTALARLDSLPVLGLHALVPLAANHLFTDDRHDYLLAWRKWSADVLKAVEDAHNHVPELSESPTAGVLAKVKGIAMVVDKIVRHGINRNRKEAWFRKRVLEVKNDICTVRRGAACFPRVEGWSSELEEEAEA